MLCTREESCALANQSTVMVGSERLFAIILKHAHADICVNKGDAKDDCFLTHW